MKSLIKKITPNFFLSFYHFLLAWIGALLYGFPSGKLIIIGITGTKEKTSTFNFIWSVLEAGEISTGIISTANIRIGNEEIPNRRHMTMPGRFTIQRYLREMVKKGIKVAVVETTSQGILQWRHVGINYDIAIFTNLSPEHIESHGNYDNYKAAKKKLFESLLKSKTKIFNGREFQKTIIANHDDVEFPYYTNVPVPRVISFGLEQGAHLRAEKIAETSEGVTFSAGGREFSSSIPGAFNIYNMLPAIIVGDIFGISEKEIKNGLQNLHRIPGRMEEINEGQNFRVFVDYAHEPKSMKTALTAARSLAGENKVIAVCGAQGGGRDVLKREPLGKVAGELADIVVVTNEDPYEDDPKIIMEDVVRGVKSSGKILGENLFVIEDRRDAIQKALRSGEMNDVVMVTGKGAEETMMVKGGAIDWNDALVLREEIKKLTPTKL